MHRIVGFLLVAGCAFPREPGSLRARLLSALAPAGGVWGVYFKDLETGQELGILEDEEFHPASTLKVWVLLKLHEDALRGRLSLQDEIGVERTFRSAATRDPRPFDVAPYAPEVAQAVGCRMKIVDLVEAMITVSDNVATNNLIRAAGGPEAVTNCLRRRGVRRSDVRRFLMDQQAFEEGLSSVAVPREFGDHFERLAKGEAVGPTADREMLAVMSRLKDNRLLPGRLPREARVAHKTGAIEGVRADVGLVTLPGGRRYVACFFSRGLRDGRLGEACLADASRVLYDHVASR